MHKRRLTQFLSVFLLLALCSTAAMADASPDEQQRKAGADDNTQHTDEPLIPSIDIPYTKYVLDNGLTLIVHEDHSSPIVAVSMWYHVGSKNEGPDQHGFAHLFEHLMFQGTAHWEGGYFEPFERAGAVRMNGTTGSDRTHYYATVPTSALDMALWMESDRMCCLLGGIDKDTLQEQIHVVLNEMRRGANQPYGTVWRTLVRNTYPEGHPYSWPTIGSAEDLKATTLEDVRQWFQTWYGPTNATLVLAGDIEPRAALKKVKHYFGGIPAGPPLTRQSRWVAPMTGEHRMTMHDRVPHPRLYMVWNVPPMGSKTATQLQLAASVLAGAKNSILYQQLVMEQGIALNVSAGVIGREIGSQFMITATPKPGVPLSRVEAEIKALLHQFVKTGPTRQALERAKTRIVAGFLRSIESVSGKARVLARGEVFHNNPAHYKQALETLRNATPESVRKAAAEWLTKGKFVLSVLPFGEHRTHDTNVDRSELPDIGPTPNLDLPEVHKARLDNGLEILLMEQHEKPLVQMSLVFDAGYAADPANMPGLASMTLAMLDEGTKQHSALEISALLDSLGATLSTSSSLDASIVSMSALSSQLADSLALYAEIVRHPAFPKDAFKRLQKQTLASIAQEKNTPTQLALRKLGPLLYGHDHAYGIPLTGTGTRESVKAMTPEDLQRFAETWLRPDNATLVIVGDTTMQAIKPLLKKYFGDWQAPDEPLPKKHITKVQPPENTRIFLIDRPGSTQTTLIAGNVTPPRDNPYQLGMATVNAILGGMFNSRLNMTLREAKHWSYGAGSVLVDARAQQPFFIYTSVQTNKAAQAMQVIHEKVRGILGDNPPTKEELAMATANLTRSLPGYNETSGQLAATLTNSVVYNLPPDYYETYVERVQSLTLDDLDTAAKRLLDPGHMTWVVVGDLDQIGDKVRALDWGKVHVLDAGKPADGQSTGGADTHRAREQDSASQPTDAKHGTKQRTASEQADGRSVNHKHSGSNRNGSTNAGSGQKDSEQTGSKHNDSNEAGSKQAASEQRG